MASLAQCQAAPLSAGTGSRAGSRPSAVPPHPAGRRLPQAATQHRSSRASSTKASRMSCRASAEAVSRTCPPPPPPLCPRRHLGLPLTLSSRAPSGRQASNSAPAVVSKEGEVLAALSRIIDPDFGMNIVDCGFIKDLAVDGEAGSVAFRLELTTPACPIKDDFEKAVGAWHTRVLPARQGLGLAADLPGQAGPHTQAQTSFHTQAHPSPGCPAGTRVRDCAALGEKPGPEDGRPPAAAAAARRQPPQRAAQRVARHCRVQLQGRCADVPARGRSGTL